MSKTEAIKHVLNPMQAVFATPARLTDEQRGTALDEYADALKGFDPRDLEEGWKAVRNANRKTSWPAIGDLIAACNEAARARREASPFRNAPLVKGRTCDGKEQDWPGACMCVKCVSARRGKPVDVWRATPEERRQGEALLAELDAWTKSRPVTAARATDPAPAAKGYVHKHSPEELEALAAKRRQLVEDMTRRAREAAE